MLESLAALVQWFTRDAVYLGQHPAVVASQAEDDTLDLIPDNEALRGTGLSAVKIRHGLPGVRVRVAAGSRVLLGFEGGNPAAPYAALWDPGSVEQILFNGGEQAVARVGDTALCYWPTLELAGTYNSLPLVCTLVAAAPSMAIISTGAAQVTA